MAKKLGVTLPSERLRAEIRRRRSEGQCYARIMRELGVSWNTVHHHAKGMQPDAYSTK